MASDLKKVGLVFNADGTTDFIKSLNSVNASLKENYQDFKAVQAQYDENTTSSQKLLDKLDYLNSAYDLQKNKVKVLAEELEDLENSENRNEVAITKKRTALKAAETQLTRYGNQIKDVDQQIKLGTANLKDYAKNIKETGEKITEAGKKFSVLSAGIVGVDTAATATAMSLESATNRFITSTGESVTETERFQNILKSIHDNNYGSDYADIATKMSLVKQQLGDINDADLQTITENAYLLEDAFGIDFNETIRGVTGLIKNMGLSADEAFNYIVVGAQNGLNKSDELTDNIAEYSQLWGQAGFSAKEMFTILQNGVDSGAYNLDKVNDFVKEFTISLTDGRIKDNLSSFSSETRNLFKEFENGKATAKDVFYSVIKDLENTENKQEALTIASNVWSSLGEDNAMAIITSLDDVNTKYDDVANKAQQAQDVMYSGNEAKLETMKKNLQSSFSSIGETLLSNIMPVLEDMANGLKNLMDWFDGLDGNTKNVITTIGLLVAAIGPLLLIMGTMASSISNIITLFTNETVAMGLNAVKKGIVTAATKTLRLAQLGLNGVMKAGSVVVGALSTVFNKQNLILAASAIKMGAITIATNAMKLAQLGLNAVLAVGKVAISGISTALNFLAANPIVLVIAAVAALVAGLIYLWNTNENFKNAIISAWTWIQNIFTSIDQFITGIFQTDWTNSFGIIGNIVNAFVANISNFYNSIKQIFQGIIDFVKGVFTGDWSLAWNGIKDIFAGIFNGLTAIAKAPLNGIIGLLNIVIDGINFLIKGLNKVKFDVPDWVPGIGGKSLGFDIKKIGKIPYLKDGGTLLNGAAIVAEAGPELLLQEGNKTKVVPLRNNSRNTPYNDNSPIDSARNVEFNQTVNINNYSRFTGDAEVARQTRNETKKFILRLRRG